MTLHQSLIAYGGGFIPGPHSVVCLAINSPYNAQGLYAGTCSIYPYSITFIPIDCQKMESEFYSHKTNSVSAPEFHPCCIDCDKMICSYNNYGLVI